jgi:uncharacterized protein (TIGR00730 family)
VTAVRRVCVFCGAQPGHDPRFLEESTALGGALASRGLGLVYGGASVGMMGAVADAALAGGGEVVGVIPRKLADRELAHPRITSLHVVETMHQRKAMMADHASGFLAMPGGFGTLEEIFEVVTWAQIGIHHKPCLLLNLGGFYDGLIGFLDGAVRSGLLRPEYRALLLEARTVDEALDTLAAHPNFGPPGDVATGLV